jgi:hypothetical protein
MDSTANTRAASSNSPTAMANNRVSSGSVGSSRDVEKMSLSDNPTEPAPKDPNVVDFDGPNDPENAMNWTTARKTTAIIIVTSMTLLS